MLILIAVGLQIRPSRESLSNDVLSCIFLHKIGGLSINVFCWKILSHSFLKEWDFYYLCILENFRKTRLKNVLLNGGETATARNEMAAVVGILQALFIRRY